MSKVIGSWHDCINPLRLPQHAHFFEITNTITVYYANKICPMCWKRIQPERNYQGLQSNPGIDKKYQTRNDRADIMPSKDYE